MVAGMSFCLPVAFYVEQRQAKHRDEEEPLLPQEGLKQGSFKETCLLAIPSFFDLAATILMNVGLLSVTASVYQMMRGAEMLFAALFAILFLQRHLNKYHYLGILCCVVGISLVGLSSILGGEGSSTHTVSTQEMMMGMGLIVLSQAVQAAQLTFEDFFMADLNMQPLKIVGFEGVFGTLFMVLLLLPIAYFLPGPEGVGFHENTLDTLKMIGSSRALQLILAIDMFALLAYNICGMMVTGHLGAVFRTVLETMRTLFVWLLGLLLWYTTPWGLGESWTAWSYLQALGFVILVLGTLVYGKGDERGAKEELSAAVTEALAATGVLDDSAADTAPLLTSHAAAAAVSQPIPARSVPVGVPPAAAASSLKATMNITSGSYSYRGSSFAASLPRNSLSHETSSIPQSRQ
eukprot:jgi/Chrzof1/7215/Cz02g15020.t1